MAGSSIGPSIRVSAERLDDRFDNMGADGLDLGAYGKVHTKASARFEATLITAVTFSDDAASSPARNALPRSPVADSVIFSGIGRWGGKPGYSFEARAQDQGEPGRARDTFSLVVRNARGIVVANISGGLTAGNIQSTRLKK